MITRLILSGALLALSGISMAADCKKTGSICVDSTPCKMVGGNQVCLSQLGLSCWNYEDTYTCLKPDAVDYCAAIKQVPECHQTGSVCATSDTLLGTGCMKWTNTWQCGASVAAPAGTVKLDTTHTIASDTIDSAACNSLASNPTCTLAAHTCTEPGGTRIINGLAVAKDCWAWRDDYSCMGPIKSDCAALQNKGCTLSSSKCVSYGLNNTCILTENVYSCQDKAASTSSVVDCGSSQYCVGGNCFDTGHTPDTDLAKATAMMEAMREAGNYMDPATLKIFGGEGGSCKNKLGGLGNCCKADGGGAGMSNASIMGYTVMAAASTAGQVLKYGSSYVYDAMFGASSVATGVSSMAAASGAATSTAGAAAAGGFSASLSMYGFTATYATEAAAAASVEAAAAASTAAIAEATAAGASAAAAAAAGEAAAAGATVEAGFTVAFDPTTLAIQVAIMVVMDYLACEEPERMLAMKKGQGLCRFNESHCSKKAISCIEVTESYCCFNSRLARIVNTAGGAQIGKPATDCSGFTPDEFTSLDFSKIDLAEFEAEIMANVKMPDAGIIGTDVGASVQNKLNNYYTRGAQ
ncbi:MAG: hypothetical protein AUJ88_05060 [Gallionellaceae bacterium CG1_02_56_997]|nr:MAG: hypothetical protein AUJ88_05060 [Gallionellaceae bacterium CG1_02_56_997]